MPRILPPSLCPKCSHEGNHLRRPLLHLNGIHSIAGRDEFVLPANRKALGPGH